MRCCSCVPAWRRRIQGQRVCWRDQGCFTLTGDSPNSGALADPAVAGGGGGECTSHRGSPLRLGKEGLPLGSAQRASPWTRHRGPCLGGPSLRLSTKGLFSGSAEGLLSGSAHISGSTQRASIRAQHRGPQLGLNTEGLLSGSAQRVSSEARHRGPRPWLGIKDLLSGRHKSLLSGLARRTSYLVVGLLQ